MIMMMMKLCSKFVLTKFLTPSLYKIWNKSAQFVPSRYPLTFLRTRDLSSTIFVQGKEIWIIIRHYNICKHAGENN